MTEVLRLLAEGEVEVEGRLPWSSNHTFLVQVTLEGQSCRAVYKPGRGERPLWDFPGGLYRREVAAFELSEALGLGLVPETVIRSDGPLGAGSLQRFVEAEFSEHYFSLLDDPVWHDALREIAGFDLLLNNADRKSGHCLLGLDGRIWAIDHGLCFHCEPKLRTVIWDFAGECLSDELVAGCASVAAGVPQALDDLLAADERDALRRRARALTRSPRLPAPHPDRRPYPWPLV